MHMDSLSDMRLVEKAAMVAGYGLARWSDDGRGLLLTGVQEPWNPLDDDGDALRLAVQLEIDIRVRSAPLKATASAPGGHWIEETGVDKREAVRRSIVRAAAALAPHLKTPN
jgi:hypothetical protein